ncbi:MAG: OmpA family protein, partial [Phycisphaerae bacterium]|nr:OmpA family protein [Gemmatimonadaceae bacterium]
RRIFASSYSGVWNDQGTTYAFDLRLQSGVDSQTAATLRWTVANPGRLTNLQSRVGTTRTRTGKGVYHEGSRSLDVEVTTEADSLPATRIEYQLTFDSTLQSFTGRTRTASGDWKGSITGENGRLDRWRVDDVCRLKRPVTDLTLSLQEGASVQVPLVGQASTLVPMAPWKNADAKVATVNQNGMITARTPGKTSMRFQCGTATSTIQVTVGSSGAPLNTREAFAGLSTLIVFPQDQTEVPASFRPLLNEWANRLQKQRDVSIDISGRTTAPTTAQYNAGPTQNSADAVRAYLVSRGVRESQLRVRSTGESDLMCQIAAPGCRSLANYVKLSIAVDRGAQAK